MTNVTHIIERRSAQMSSAVLKETSRRLRAKGQDSAADRLDVVAKALDDADTIHIAPVVARA